ncbi:hypothetical protein M514_10772 [Trichuris suis]|uniref:Uncharacterized protein n=1 Tax=Trichuris suis TaxID=68888 RepID=A0A085MYJ7_9BILA|nr:hypothetical protein M513_10772 [Trichuris suis]KFD62293.1 hypothetical protein M514_10772 [Trichuris suis]
MKRRKGSEKYALRTCAKRECGFNAKSELKIGKRDEKCFQELKTSVPCCRSIKGSCYSSRYRDTIPAYN